MSKPTSCSNILETGAGDSTFFIESYEWKGSENSNEKIILYAAGFEIRLKRNLQKYIMNFYIPSGLMVTVSWVRF